MDKSNLTEICKKSVKYLTSPPPPNTQILCGPDIKAIWFMFIVSTQFFVPYE